MLTVHSPWTTQTQMTETASLFETSVTTHPFSNTDLQHKKFVQDMKFIRSRDPQILFKTFSVNILHKTVPGKECVELNYLHAQTRLQTRSTESISIPAQ